MKVYFRQSGDLYTFFTKNDKDKENIVPREQCTLGETRKPSAASIAYWNHYGIDRNKFDQEAIDDGNN
jgi:hypothetical protein